jgi:quercetin dioxygenase-like cupin family protein
MKTDVTITDLLRNRLLAAGLATGLAAGLAIAVPSLAQAQDSPLPEGFATEPLLSATTTRDDDPITWPEGAPKIISVTGTIEAGGRTPLHQHPVPTFVYVLEGEVELRTEGGNPHTYRAGEAYIEALNRDHQLFNVSDSDARVLVVFVGADDVPTTVASQ